MCHICCLIYLQIGIFPHNIKQLEKVCVDVCVFMHMYVP